MAHADAARDEAAFSMRVLRHLASRAGSSANLAVSPLSLHAALALLGAGARGATLDDIVAFLGPAGAHAHAALASHVALRVLADSGGLGPDSGGGGFGPNSCFFGFGSGLNSGGGAMVRFANSVWVDVDLRLNDAYSRVVTEHYRAQARPAPFRRNPEEARGQINKWVAAATAGRMNDVVSPGSINSATAAVVANALYFKCAWKHKFRSWDTRDGDFFLPATGGTAGVPFMSSAKVRVQFMSSSREQYVVRRSGYKVLRLPYAHGSDRNRFSMYIYLPDDRGGLPSMLHKLSSDPALLESSGTMAREVPLRRFQVPRFTVEHSTDATAMLRDLGLRLPFDAAAADFSDMMETAPDRRLFVSEVHHKCFVEVDEEGTEAFAATTFGCTATSAAPAREPEEFVADHPFMFLIKEDTSGVVVFAGQVVNPSLSPRYSMH
ncbi:unnamed protein product [Urochloa decumbens]|uniref:Serpin domain-containing protein n=1 Tax=Urochloa decumbens TaxID=240449 RepID=A0ABC8Z404_9POAL